MTETESETNIFSFVLVYSRIFSFTVNIVEIHSRRLKNTQKLNESENARTYFRICIQSAE